MTTYADPGAKAPRPRRPVDEPPRNNKKSGKNKGPKRPPDPTWAKWCMIVGSIVMVISGGVVVVPKAITAWFTKDLDFQSIVPDEVQPATIDGPINMLLLGMDERAGAE